MKKIYLMMAITFWIAICVSPLPAQQEQLGGDIEKVAQVGFQFLKADVGARAAAMGGAFMMTGYDASSQFYNSAGIAMTETDVDVFFGQTQWIADITYNAAAVTKKFGNVGTFGLTILMADYGDIEGTRVASNEAGFEDIGNVDVGAFAVGLSYARRISDQFSIGGQVKYAGQKLGSNLIDTGETVDNTAGGLVFDFGTIFYPGFRSFRFGVSARNFSSEFEYANESFQLPLTFTMGVAIDMFDLIGPDVENQSFVVSVEAINPRDFSERVHVGGEYWFQDLIALRGGYKFNYDEESFSAGVGFNVKLSNVRLKVDYAYSDFGVFDNVNRFSVGFAF